METKAPPEERHKKTAMAAVGLCHPRILIVYFWRNASRQSRSKHLRSHKPLKRIQGLWCLNVGLLESRRVFFIGHRLSPFIPLPTATTHVYPFDVVARLRGLF